MPTEDKSVQRERQRVDSKLNLLQAAHTAHEAHMDELGKGVVEEKPRPNICKSCFANLSAGKPHREKCELAAPQSTAAKIAELEAQLKKLRGEA